MQTAIVMRTACKQHDISKEGKEKRAGFYIKNWIAYQSRVYFLHKRYDITAIKPIHREPSFTQHEAPLRFCSNLFVQHFYSAGPISRDTFPLIPDCIFHKIFGSQ